MKQEEQQAADEQAPCGISRALEVIGAKWTVLMVRDLLEATRAEAGKIRLDTRCLSIADVLGTAGAMMQATAIPNMSHRIGCCERIKEDTRTYQSRLHFHFSAELGPGRKHRERYALFAPPARELPR